MLRYVPAPNMLSHLICAGFPKRTTKLHSENIALEITPGLSLPTAVSLESYFLTACFELTNL